MVLVRERIFKVNKPFLHGLIFLFWRRWLLSWFLRLARAYNIPAWTEKKLLLLMMVSFVNGLNELGVSWTKWTNQLAICLWTCTNDWWPYTIKADGFLGRFIYFRLLLLSFLIGSIKSSNIDSISPQIVSFIHCSPGNRLLKWFIQTQIRSHSPLYNKDLRCTSKYWLVIFGK